MEFQTFCEQKAIANPISFRDCIRLKSQPDHLIPDTWILVLGTFDDTNGFPGNSCAALVDVMDVDPRKSRLEAMTTSGSHALTHEYERSCRECTPVK
ncbi:hypothetical protein NPIL_35431 [Nephila pilipes]|uniref:Uncharacterized protein n=1 Tax=Nephila pilipes TaxID=299642 RepID=A0A8X6Q9A3_NEPPI|nr:hypothetical protein NPIL_35431 [Nephila pilipes]